MTNEKLTERKEIRRMKKTIEDMHKFNTEGTYDELEINGTFYSLYFDDNGSFAFGTVSKEKESDHLTYTTFDSVSFLYYLNIGLDDLTAAYLFREVK